MELYSVYKNAAIIKSIVKNTAEIRSKFKDDLNFLLAYRK